MSTTPDSVACSDAERVARDPTDLYTNVVHESPEICSNCHERIRAPRRAKTDRLVETPDITDCVDPETLGTGDDPMSNLRRGPAGYLGHDIDKTDDYGQALSWTTRTYCDSCGQAGGRARDDVPPKTQMLAACDPLVERFTERGIPINPDVLRHTVAHLRNQPEYCGQETEIWRAACAVATKRARPRDCVRITFRGPHHEHHC